MAEPSLAGNPSPPRWLDPIDPKNRGLDLLGLRLPVQSIGNSLMDGITTITPVVRNFSIRTWLVSSYINARRPDDWASFREYAASAEACLALGNSLAETGALGVVGSEEAARLLADGEGDIDLKPLVSQLAAQIYANPSDEIGLTFSRESGIPGITLERGTPLVDFIDSELGKCKIGAALRSAKDLKKADRESLKVFGKLVALNAIRDAERDMLAAAIIPADPQPSEIRRLASFALLLSLTKTLGRLPREKDFFSDVADAKSESPDCLLEVRDGWLRYLVRDSLAVCHEASLAAVVLGIRQLQSSHSSTVRRSDVLDWVINQSAKERASLETLGVGTPSGSIETWKFRDVVGVIDAATQSETGSENLIDRWPGNLQEWDLGNLSLSLGGGAPVLLPIAWLLARRRAEKEVDEATIESRVLSHQGWSRLGLEQVILPQLEKYEAEDWPFLRVVDALVQRTVDQHLRIAWSRLRSERPPRDVAVLTSDGQRWCFRKTFSGGRTASRVSQAISWLRQLGLVGDEGLTEAGDRILRRSLNALEQSA